MKSPTAYPLQWPNGWPKTDPKERESGNQFKVSIEGALKSLNREVELLGGTTLVLSSNYNLTARNPKEPGVVAYFTYENTQVAIPCDRWARIEANVRAIALTIEAMRGMERWGAKHMIKAMFSGFKALPDRVGHRPWQVVMQLADMCAEADARKRYRDLARARHPDSGGNEEAMSELNQAWEECQKERGWK
jgi:hypothetical protein